MSAASSPCPDLNLIHYTSPALSWKNPPAGTKSFVLTVYDKDAPTGLGWMHWVVADIPADVRSLPAGITAQGGRLPKGALQTRTDFGTPGYGGACPPEGREHRYEFTLTALKVAKLPNITAESTPALVGFFTKANSLGEAKFTVEHRR
ncbi:YbhB/YbcL family Raf kinase inhibitor-like protein [Neisseria uirgultaei]|uniref:YbhB/YbcL family Raf kinase inhibitor-like protein n=1 Tax=Neisseria uirgultaei TaxID=2830646 RepID=UPI0035713EBC